MTFIARRQSIEWTVRALVPVLLGGVACGTFWVASFFDKPPGLTLASFAMFTAFIFLIAEGVRVVSRTLDRRVAWRDGVVRRALWQLVATIAFSIAFALLIYVPLKLSQIHEGSRDTIAWPHLALTAALALCLALAINALQIVFDFYKSWQTARIEADCLREIALKAELEALKAQVNPHFLFNSLNALYGLVDEDPQRARALVLELSDVFRYALTHAYGDLVTLAQELQFLDAYAALLGARHGNGLLIERDTGGEESLVSLPPMTLQLLVENAVKHNRVDPGDGLLVRIVREGDTLIVSNPLKPKRGATTGAGVGLDNIDQRYRLLSLRGVDVRRENARFIVRVPLLPCLP